MRQPQSDKQPQDVALDAEVVGDDVQALIGADVARPVSCHVLPSFHWKGRLADTTLARSMPFSPGNLRAAFTAAFSSTCSPVMMQPDCAPFSRSRRVSLRVSMPAMATMRPRSRNSGSGSTMRQLLGEQWQVADHEAGGIDLRGFQILGRGAGIADVRIGERDDLAGVGGIGEDFLVSGQRGIENDFASGVALGSDGLAAEDGTVRQRQHRRYAHGFTFA